jgi:hypothetical protein
MIPFPRKLLRLAQRRQKDAEPREELEFHLSEETKLQADTGLAETAARSAPGANWEISPLCMRTPGPHGAGRFSINSFRTCDTRAQAVWAEIPIGAISEFAPSRLIGSSHSSRFCL